MSLTKRLIEQQISDDALFDALQAILDKEILQHDVAIGIAKLVLSKRSLESLSDKQRDVFTQHIAPHLNFKCEECGCKIPPQDYSEAVNSWDYDGELLCVNCAHTKDMRRRAMARDD